MLSKEEIEKAKKKLELMEYKYTLTDNDDKAIETLLQYIDQLEQENKTLKGTLSNELDRDKKTCFYEDGNTGKCLGYSNVNDDEPCEYCKIKNEM